MIIMMQALYNTVHVGDRVHYNVSEFTWQSYGRYIRWAEKEYRTVSLMFQGGWAIKIEEDPNA